MKQPFRAWLALILCICMLPGVFALGAAAQETRTEEPEQVLAEDISGYQIVTDSTGFPGVHALFDGGRYPLYNVARQSSLTLSHEAGIGSLYLIFQKAYGEYTLRNEDTGAVATCGGEGYLHEFVDVEAVFGAAPTSVTISFDNGPVQITELSVYTPGQVPESVQKWNAPAQGETDLLLYSAHGDDEHLFFGGILPYYGAELGYRVQVVYMTDHWNEKSIRVHEMLDGLWAVGCTTYPVFGNYYDFRESSLDITYRAYERLGYSREGMMDFVVTQMRRFKPKVVVTHDFDGEYGHGMHMVLADLVAKALEVSNDPQQYPETAEQYGVWDVPKAYFHLYQENEIYLDWDRPLESFDGETAFMVSVYRGFQCHKSQIRDFAWYYAGYPDARSIRKYNPCYYGLYRTTVGEDVEKDDFFENVTTHAEDRLAYEAQLLEEARLKAEEEARIQAEEAARKQAEEEARRKAEEEARLAREQAEAEAAAKAALEQRLAQQRKQKQILISAGAAALAVTAAIVWFCCRKNKLKKSEKI